MTKTQIRKLETIIGKIEEFQGEISDKSCRLKRAKDELLLMLAND